VFHVLKWLKIRYLRSGGDTINRTF
jgi:predicted RNA-binding protein with TRAM domain